MPEKDNGFVEGWALAAGTPDKIHAGLAEWFRHQPSKLCKRVRFSRPAPNLTRPGMTETLDFGHLRSLHHKLDLILSNQEKIMSALDDLNAEESALATSVATIQSTVTATVAAIAALTAAIGSNDDAGVEAAVTNLKSLGTALDSANTALSAALPPPAPAAAPATPPSA